jgi:hypothetical protein
MFFLAPLVALQRKFWGHSNVPPTSFLACFLVALDTHGDFEKIYKIVNNSALDVLYIFLGTHGILQH